MDDESDLPAVPVGSLLAEIDAQQDDLLRQLDELNSRLELVLRQCTPAGDQTPMPQLVMRAA